MQNCTTIPLNPGLLARIILKKPVKLGRSSRRTAIAKLVRPSNRVSTHYLHSYERPYTFSQESIPKSFNWEGRNRADRDLPAAFRAALPVPVQIFERHALNLERAGGFPISPCPRESGAGKGEMGLGQMDVQLPTQVL